jgi:Na+-transporting NADH:ubiquinone oxidoreductase subunit NqrB
MVWLISFEFMSQSHNHIDIGIHTIIVIYSNFDPFADATAKNAFHFLMALALID